MHSPYAGMGMNPMAFVDVDGQEAITLAALGVAALKGAIIASIASAVKYSSEAVAFETWDWGDFGKTVGVSAAMGAVGGAAGGAVKLGGVAMFGAEGVTSGAGLLVTSTTHGLTQGGISAAMGGNFWSGVASGFAGHYVGAGLANAGMEGFGAAAASSVMGGAMSALSGGSFFEGAVVGLIVHMCNQQMGNSEVEKKALQKAHDSYVWRGFEQKDFGVLNDAQRTAHIMNAIRHVNKRGGYTLNIHKVFKDFRHIQSAGAVLGYNSGHVSLSIGDVSFKAQIDLGVFPRANGEYSPIIDISLQRIGEDRYFNYNHNTGKAEHWKAAVGFMLNFATTASQFNYVIEWMGY